jgi:WD40 repeat protein
MRTSAVFLLFPFLLLPVNAQIDRRDRHDPELVIETGGRTGTCDAMLFDLDGNNLYAVGDDKVVRAWTCDKKGLDTAKMRSIRWPAWRERRGGIKALAVAKDGRIAIGGYGLLVNSIAVIDPSDGEAGKILAMHPREPEKVTDTKNYFAVMCAQFSDDGKLIAFGTADGSVWLWKPGSTPKLLGCHEFMTDPGTGKVSDFNRPRMVGFMKSGMVISVSQSGELRGFNQSGEGEPYIRRLIKMASAFPNDQDTWPDGIYRAALSPDREWVAIGLNGPLIAGYYLPRASVASKSIRLEKNQFVRALAFDRDSKQLAVAIGSVPRKADFSIEADDQIGLIDNIQDANWKLRPGPAHSFRADALAFHKDGRLAVAGGDNHEVKLWDLSRPNAPQSVARGSGRCLWGIRVSADGKAIGFQPKRDANAIDPNRRGASEFVAFSLEAGAPLEAKTQWIEPIESLEGWRIVGQVDGIARDRFNWYAVHKDVQKPLLIPIDPDRDEWPRCWSFLPRQKDEKEKKAKPLQLVVGHFYGCSLYDVEATGVTRRFTCIGHSGEVVSIGPSKDGSWFVTTGTDQTVAAWSADRIPKEQLLGASLFVEDQQLMVRDVAVCSPAYEMGLVKGDRIVFMWVGGKIEFNEKALHDKEYGPNRGDPESCLQKLQNLVPGYFVHLGIRRAGRAKMIEVTSSLPRRPLWRFFPAFDDKDQLSDYLAWLWWNPYYLSSINGDSLTGWCMNRQSMVDTPNFYRAAQLRDQLEDKKLLREVLMTRDLTRALATTRELHFEAIEPAPVRIEASSLKVGEKGINLNLIVKKRNDNPDLLPERVDLWIEDHLYEYWEPKAKEFAAQVPLPLGVFRNGTNRIVLKTKNMKGLDNEAEIFVEASREVGLPKLHGVFIGANNYDPKVERTNNGDKLPELRFAKSDAQSLGERWKQHQGKDRYFLPGNQKSFLDDQVRAAAILDHLEALERDNTIQTDDLLVLFFAGHGLDLELSGTVPDRKTFQFVFCCPDFIEKKHTTTGISGDVLVRKLARIRCRKLLILDACKSGLATDSDLAREMAIKGQKFVIMTACGTSEVATEDKALGHGLFTAALLEALDPKNMDSDTNGDGILDAHELFVFVKKRVKALVDKTGSRNMTPVCHPSPPDRIPIARLSRN